MFSSNLNFDVYIFRDFLTGFHKRKLARKKKARDDFEKKLKEEKKRIKTEVKYISLRYLLKTFPINIMILICRQEKHF